jgi:hypothetical protein
MIRDDSLASRLWRIAIWALVVVFVLNVVAVIAVVVIDSVAARWFGTWLPPALTAHWYSDAWDDFQLTDILIVTCSASQRPTLWRGATSPASRPFCWSFSCHSWCHL